MNNFTQNLLCDLSNVVELSQDQKFQPRKLHCYKNMCQTISFYFRSIPRYCVHGKLKNVQFSSLMNYTNIYILG